MHECVCAKPVCFLLFKNKRDKILSKKMILKNVETKALRIVSRFYFGPSHTNSDCLRIDRCPKSAPDLFWSHTSKWMAKHELKTSVSSLRSRLTSFGHYSSRTVVFFFGFNRK